MKNLYTVFSSNKPVGNWETYKRNTNYPLTECLAAKKDRPFTDNQLELFVAGAKLAGKNFVYVFNNDDLETALWAGGKDQS